MSSVTARLPTCLPLHSALPKACLKKKLPLLQTGLGDGHSARCGAGGAGGACLGAKGRGRRVEGEFREFRGGYRVWDGLGFRGVDGFRGGYIGLVGFFKGRSGFRV